MTVGNIISMLKEISDNGNKKYSVTNFGGVVNFKITFFDKIPNDVTNKLIDLNLPDEVIELLSCTNGLNLFEDEFQGMELGGPVCKIYSGQEILNRYQESIDKDLIPILLFRDYGEMCINIRNYKQKKDYLTYPGMEMDKCFKCTFLKWLEMFIVANGNAFWEWNF